MHERKSVNRPELGTTTTIKSNGETKEYSHREPLDLVDLDNLPTPHISVGTSVEVGTSRDYGKQSLKVRTFISIPCGVNEADVKRAFDQAYEICKQEADQRAEDAWNHFFGGGQ